MVGWLWITHHIQSGPRHGNSHPVPRDRQPYHVCGELRRLPRRPPGNRTRVAGTEAQMHASAPTAPLERFEFHAQIFLIMILFDVLIPKMIFILGTNKKIITYPDLT